MLKIHQLKIKNLEAKGIVYADELTEKQLRHLHMSIEDKDGFCAEVDTYIDYSVEWDCDLAMPLIEEVTLVYGNTFLTLDKDQYDYDDLSLQLEYELPYTELKEDKESYYEDNYYGDDS